MGQTQSVTMGSDFGVTADSKKQLDLDGVGIWWITWASVWTLVLLCGMAYLVHRRDSPILRIRGIGLSLAAVISLHLYYFSVQLGYVVGALAPGDCEYWIMGTYLPFGIALFHASNSRFLYVAKVQKKYLSRPVDRPAKSRRRMGILDRFRALNYTTKMIIVVSLGMGFQLFLTLITWLMSRKWHSGWGIPGTEVHGTEMEQKMEMGRGWEWWPGIFWQFVWAWIVAPCILWKSRNINDIHGWRIQTIGCAVAGLHATPMWLIALYVPGMEPVNKYFLPPQWICISILVLEILTVFLPCWEVMQATTLRQETLDSIAQWEKKNKPESSAKSVKTASTAIDSLMTGRKSTAASVKSTDSRESVMTMSALEYVLERNPTPLQEFSSLRDFSGENIAFLTSVTEWKSSLPRPVRDGVKDSSTRELVRERFNGALRIYTEFISIKDAEFPINISSTELRRMEAVFETCARILYGDKLQQVDPATPFDLPATASKTSTEMSSNESDVDRPAIVSYSDGVKFWGEVPESFDETVFDESEKHIKYLVLTNTWPKFVKDRRLSVDMGACAEKGPSVMSFMRNRRQKNK